MAGPIFRGLLTGAGGGGGGGGGTAYDDDFATGSSIDTTGARFAGANPWTKLNAGASTYAVTGGQLVLTPEEDGNFMNPRLAVQTPPAGDWAFRTYCTSASAANYAGLGLVLRESGSGKLLCFGLGDDGGLLYQVRRLTSYTGWFANYGSTAAANPSYLEVARTGSNLIFRYSTDDVTYTTYITVAQTTDFTTAPDQIGLWAQAKTVGGTTQVATFDRFWKAA